MSLTQTRSTFLLGAATNWLAFAATLAVAFFLTPYLIHRLGAPRYDVWCVVEAILAYFTLLDMGVAACLVRAVAARSTTTDHHGLNRMISTCLGIFTLGGVVAMLVGVPVLLYFAHALHSRAASDPTVLPFMLLMLGNVALTLPASVFPSILDGLSQYTLKSLIRLVFLALRTIGMVLAVQWYGTLFPLAVVYTVANLLEHLLFAVTAHRRLPGMQIHWRWIDRTTLNQVRTYSIDAFLALLAGRITVQTAAVVIGVLLPGGQVTFFATAARLVEYSKGLLRTITTTLTPNVSALEARGDHVGIRKLFITGSRWALYFVLPIQVGLVFFGAPFLARWVGPEFIDGSYPALVALSCGLTLAMMQSVAARMLYGLGRLRWFARIGLLEAALNVGLLYLMVKPLGVAGAAIAVMVPNVLACTAVILYTLRVVQLSCMSYVRLWIAPLVCTGLCGVVWWFVGQPGADYGQILATACAGLVPYLMAVAAIEGFLQMLFTRLIKRLQQQYGNAVPTKMPR